jgi:heme exporter protein B
VNAAAKSFLQESRGRLLYLYTLASPEAIILSRVLYNILLLFVLALLCYGFYALLIGNLVQDTGLFLCTVVLGSMGFSCVLTLVSAIASKSSNNFTLMAILSFPVMLPLLLLLIKLSKDAIDGLGWDSSYKYLGALLALNVIVCTLAYLLFPYLWRD